jgi:acetyl esterase
MQSKVPTTAIRFLGTIHDFVMMNAIADTPDAREAIDQGSHALREALSHHE